MEKLKKSNKRIKKTNTTSKKKKFKFNKKTVKMILKILLITFILGIIAAIITVALFLRSIVENAPEFDPNKLYQQEATIIYDSEGKMIAKLGTEKRENITIHYN